MKSIKILLSIAAALCFAIVSNAQPPTAKIEQELIQIQKDWAEARVKRDVAFLEKLYAKELRITALDGNIIERAADIADFASGDLKPEIARNDDLKISVYGETAIVSGIEYVKGTYKNNPGEFWLRFTNVYVRRENRWQLVSHQTTEMRGKNKETASTIEETVRRLDDEEREAALKRGVKTLERLWSDNFTVNAPNNRVVAGKQAVLETFVRSGIDFSRYERKIETVIADGNFVFIMGLETLVPNTDAPSAGLVAGQTVYRRYTNIWRKENNVWRLFARHANVIPPAPRKPPNN